MSTAGAPTPAPTRAELAAALEAVFAQLDDMAMGLTALHATLDPARGVLLRWNAHKDAVEGEAFELMPQPPEVPRIAQWLERNGYRQIADAVRREEWRDADAAPYPAMLNAVRDRWLEGATLRFNTAGREYSGVVGGWREGLEP